jgi:GNAT superfamily N-acetyltransferase
MSRSPERLTRLTNALPTGFAAHEGDVERDAAELTVLTNENARVVGNPLMYSEGDMREDLTSSGFDVRSDAIVVREPAGAIAGWAWVMSATDAEKPRVYLFGGVRPGFQGIGLGRHLFAWSQDRAEEILAPFPGATIQTQCVEGDQRAQQLYVAAGMRPIRYYTDMLLRFADRPTSTDLADAPIPDGYRSVAITDLDPEALRGLRNHCFADHWGTSSMSAADWRDYLAAESMRLGMSEAITDAHGRLVASQLTSEFPQDAETIGRVLWLGNLGVHREHRNKGLARLLLERHLIRSVRDGYEGSMLDVDTESLTGANRLYESMGYRKSSGAVRYIFGDAKFS